MKRFVLLIAASSGLVAACSDDDGTAFVDLRTDLVAGVEPGEVDVADLYMATRATPAGPWNALEPVTGVNTASEESDPSITADGLELFFASEQRSGDHDLFEARRVITCPS